MRSLASFLVLLVAGLMVPLSTAGWWLRETVVPRSAYVETVAPLAEDPGLQDAVRNRLEKQTLEALGDVPPAVDDQVEVLVRRATTAVVRSPAFARAWKESNRAAHAQLVGALSGDSETVGVGDGSTVELRLGPLSAAVREQIEKAGLPFEVAVPRVDTTYPIGSTDDLGRAREGFGLLREYGRALPAVTAVLLVLGLALARRFGLALAGTAVVALLGLGALWLGLAAGRSGYLDALPPAVPEVAGAGYFDILTAGLRDLMRWVALGCGAALLLGLVGSAFGGRRAPER